MGRVIGLGGLFLKAKDPKELIAWYEKHLGIQFNGSTYTDWKLKTPMDPKGRVPMYFLYSNRNQNILIPVKKK